MTTLVTGANGFVGSALCARLRRDGFSVRGAVRSLNSKPSGVEALAIGSLSSETDWTTALKNVDQVVHLAARVHVMNDKSPDPLVEFRRVNVEGTAALARQAAGAGVRRLVFLSSVKVNGEFTEACQPFTADDLPAPKDAYGASKQEAEQLLRQIATETGMEVVIIRPPLVYGPGVKANFESMMRWLARGLPLPLAAMTQNCRSLVALDNLVDLIVTCSKHSAAANQTFLVSDGEDLSTAELLKRIGAAIGHPARLFYAPPGLLKLGATVLNKPGIYQRLCGSLQLDIAKTRQLLGWTPPVSVDEGLRRAAEGFCP
ncbi:SDR family oxidoreductase [Laribacter hongkongensis]|uniref:UDP-glucose 4-epimerase family protein n=1 Tax=Laribacter hongkongensis TaxID=168471 RepID=UPI001EFE5A54|nr:SDR family oxidoreductase [Laribacter hongkongensis]MCG9101342.1 SDR family oxidoreductase [Laribacter hongkongensis]MCG9104096.1 SDR family oxidoreductase [Laribacter hongkongensis]MCG9113428.1 SDR family oxidoreductase [Laribacter hongkongensis]MCG9118931.1 SDR family oxidoreductase [Laribacter hongkongensis]